MRRILTVISVGVAVIAILGWYFLAPPLGFYNGDFNGKLRTKENKSLIVYNPRYRLHWTGMSIQSGNFKQDNQYLFCWFWSGYGVKSMQIYSNTGELLHDKSYGTKKDIISTSSFNLLL